jgi:hypothetical protein
VEHVFGWNSESVAVIADYVRAEEIADHGRPVGFVNLNCAEVQMNLDRAVKLVWSWRCQRNGNYWLT